MAEPEIFTLTESDYPEVERIFRQGIAGGNATFETEAPDWEQWDRYHHPSCRFFASLKGKPAGWAALSKVSSRKVFSGIGEVSIYIDNAHQGKKVGDRLLEHLVRSSEREGMWLLQAGIFPENKVSISLHSKHGFRVVGVREKMGQMADGTWRDVVLMERRSKVNGQG